eukprot:4468405-Pyramimonas_sp.AAC.1
MLARLRDWLSRAEYARSAPRLVVGQSPEGALGAAGDGDLSQREAPHGLGPGRGEGNRVHVGVRRHARG